ncbi:hypothetical protein [Nocardia yunnanensis]|nr:hypothetical protein [Nocardia yunnanensis]
MTQEELAEVLGFKLETIQKWEQRATAERPVIGQSAAALDTLLASLDPAGMARFEVALADAGLINSVDGEALSEFERLETGTSEGAEHGPEEDDDMKRRQLFVAGTVAGLTILAPPRRAARIGMPEAQRLSKRVGNFVTTEQTVGGGALAQLARADLENAKAALTTCEIDSAVAPLFASAAGNMAVTAGWLYYDNDDQLDARDCYRDAMALANETGDDELAAHTCLNVALQITTQARRGAAHPTSALRSISRAADLTRRQSSGRIHALIASRQATAYACLGDRSAFARAVATAWREMDLASDHEPIEECAGWLKFLCHNEIRYHEACGYAYLGEASRAAELFEQVAAERTGQRNAANYRAWLASSLAEVGNIDDAVSVAADVLDNLGRGVSSGRTLRVLEPVRAAAVKPRHLEFQQRYDRFATPD